MKCGISASRPSRTFTGDRIEDPDAEHGQVKSKRQGLFNEATVNHKSSVEQTCKTGSRRTDLGKSFQNVFSCSVIFCLPLYIQLNMVKLTKSFNFICAVKDIEKIDSSFFITQLVWGV